MRLTCPNCAAQYEVDATLIPDDGRDVQCSNCSKTWFELPPTAGEAETSAPVVSAPMNDALDDDPDEGDADDWNDPDAATAEVEDAAEDADSDADTDTDKGDSETPDSAPNEPVAAENPGELDDVSHAQSEPVTPPPEKPKRCDVDPRALDILKQEADQELARRRAEREENIESQPEFNLSASEDTNAPSRALRARMARLRGESEPRPARPEIEEEDVYKPPERELLPDIDEINSSLRPADAESNAGDAAKGKSFRRGFGTMIAIAAILIIAYIAAPSIVRALPGTKPMMVAYVDAANGLRDLVDGIAR